MKNGMEIISKSEAAKRWPEIRGDETLRINYDLDADSVVFDVGGYKGRWTEKISSRYGCTIHVFEPVTEFADVIEQKFADIDRVHIYRFGLGSETGTFPISILRDSSSFYKDMGNYRDALIVKAADFILENQIRIIDLMEINIEGGEYDLLDHLIESELMLRIENIQIQFHDIVPNVEQRVTKIQRGLERTHELVYRFPFIWEGWKIKNG